MQYNGTTKKEQVLFGKDNVTIPKYNSGIAGGRTLDVTGFPLKTIFAGHVIIKKTVNSAPVYYPMPIVAVEDNGTPVYDADGNPVYEYDTLPQGASYAGILADSIATSDGRASIMIDGLVNIQALPFAITSIKSAFSAALPNIIFVEDEIA